MKIFKLSQEVIEIPPEPNAQTIPSGTIRRFHVTNPENIESIRSNGLQMKNAKGIEGPRAIYSWKTWDAAREYAGGDDYAIVEFYHPKDAYNSHPYATHLEVPPENILGIHERWHELYREMLSDKEFYDNIKQWTMEDLNNFPDYLKAIRAIDKNI